MDLAAHPKSCWCWVTGTADMIALCRDAGLPELEFRQTGGQFVQTIWRPKTAMAAQVTEVLGALPQNIRGTIGERGVD
jgi:hypothetical protein